MDEVAAAEAAVGIESTRWHGLGVVGAGPPGPGGMRRVSRVAAVTLGDKSASPEVDEPEKD